MDSDSDTYSNDNIECADCTASPSASASASADEGLEDSFVMIGQDNNVEDESGTNNSEQSPKNPPKKKPQFFFQKLGNSISDTSKTVAGSVVGGLKGTSGAIKGSAGFVGNTISEASKTVGGGIRGVGTTISDTSKTVSGAVVGGIKGTGGVIAGGADMAVGGVIGGAGLVKDGIVGGVQLPGKIFSKAGAAIFKMGRRVAVDDTEASEELAAFYKYIGISLAVSFLAILAYTPCSLISFFISGRVLKKTWRFAKGASKFLRVAIYLVSLVSFLLALSHRFLGFILGIAIRRVMGGDFVCPEAYHINFNWVSLRLGFDRNEIVISNMTWTNPSKFSHYPYFIKINFLRISLESSSIYKYFTGLQDLVVDEISVDGLSLFLEKNSKGAFNFESALQSPKNDNTKDKKKDNNSTETSIQKRPLKVELNRFLVDNLRVNVWDKSLQMGDTDNQFKVKLVVLTRAELTKKPKDDVNHGHRRARAVNEIVEIIVKELIKDALQENSRGVLMILSSGLFKSLLSAMKLDQININALHIPGMNKDK